MVLRALRFVVFSLLPLATLVALSEGLLTWAGLGDPEATLSISRGFSAQARYLVPHPDRPGWWRTQMQEGAFPEVEVPPKGGRRRVLMIGGSNVQGFPTPKLEKALNLAEPDPGFEVINLGRRGYGSERCRILLDQALVLQPDIVLIYMGHNEFVERNFALELIDCWGSPWMARVAERLSRLRSLNVLVPLFAGQPAAPADGAGPSRAVEPWRGHDPRIFDHITYDETLFVYEAYRANLRAMCDAATAHGARVLLSTVVGNMFYPPSNASLPGGPPARPDRPLREREESALALVPQRFLAGLVPTRLVPDRPARLTSDDWGQALTDAQREQRLAEPLASQPPVPPRLRPLAPPFDGGPFWNEPALWTPPVRRLLETFGAVHDRRLIDDERHGVERALSMLDDAQARAPRDAWLLYERGLLAHLLGNDDLASRLLRESSRYDLAPARGNDVTNDIVREVAASSPGVALIDAEQWVCAACPSGLVGYELMMDNCHFHGRAQPVLMQVFLTALLAAR